MENVIELSLSRNYVKHWSWKEAIRELVQNALDCKNHSIVSTYDGQLIIRTENGSISRTSLLLGESGKSEDGDTIGHFGEGLKLALLILAREGYDVTVCSGKDMWTPFLSYSEKFQTECLHIKIEEDSEAEEDVVEIRVSTLSNDQMEFIDNMYIHNSLFDQAIMEFEGNRVYEPYVLHGADEEDDDYPARVYVGGLYVCDLPHGWRYSYDLRPGRVSLDRDRKTVGTWDMCWEVARLYTQAGRADILVELSKKEAKDVEGYTESHRSYSSYSGGGSYREGVMSFDKKLSKLAAESFIERNGKKAIPVDAEMQQDKRRLMNLAIHRAGYVPVVVKRSEFAMIGKEIQLPEDIVIIKKPDAVVELKTILQQYKIAPAAKAKLQTLLEDLQAWEDFNK